MGAVPEFRVVKLRVSDFPSSWLSKIKEGSVNKKLNFCNIVCCVIRRNALI